MANYPVFDGHNDSLFEVHYKDISGGRDFFAVTSRAISTFHVPAKAAW